MHRARIASVSKPITRVAIARLVQGTSLTNESKVFGSNSVLGGQFATPSNNKKIEDITVDHLVRHRGGFVNVNKDGARSDPMFAYAGTDHKGLIEWTLANYPLGYDPGTVNYDPDNDPTTNDMYSNFGYSLLGRVIEARSGKSYETYVRDTILRPAGAGGMVIGGDRLADRKPMEVKAAHIGAQRLGHLDRAVGLLVVLHHRDQRAADGHAGAVEGVHELGLAGFRIAPARLHAAGLEIAAVGAGDLAVGAATAARLRGRRSCAPRSPCRRCTAASRGTAGRASAAPPRRASHALVLGVAVGRARDDADQLDLLELVLADHAARVAPGAAGLGAEARRVRGHAQRQRSARTISSRTRLVSGTSAVGMR
jgi:hypothetical protein